MHKRSSARPVIYMKHMRTYNPNVSGSLIITPANPCEVQDSPHSSESPCGPAIAPVPAAELISSTELIARTMIQEQQNLSRESCIVCAALDQDSFGRLSVVEIVKGSIAAAPSVCDEQYRLMCHTRITAAHLREFTASMDGDHMPLDDYIRVRVQRRTSR